MTREQAAQMIENMPISHECREFFDTALNALKQPEIIRCKNCKYYNSKPDSHGDRCDKIHWSRNDDWFCADGKLRSE